jgi:NAD(P)-dependent dehydrogenase (short-subunit alcohol dehydrogenase family)
MRFEKKVAVITAAGAGIGKATALIMAHEGATVVAVDTDAVRLDALVAEAASGVGRVVARRANALEPKEATAVVADAIRAHGRIDILVNAVGGSTIVPKPAAGIDELTVTEWKRLIDFNLDATFLFTNAVVPTMKAAGRGKIVNLASIAGRGVSGASSSAYAAAKSGIIALTKKLGTEFGPHGITMNAIAPSLTLTERIRPHWNQRSPEAQAAELQRTPLRRVAEASDQAKVICFLASSDADFVNGVTIDVTGGI